MSSQKPAQRLLYVFAVLLFLNAGVFAQGTLQITTTTLPSGTVGQTYPQQTLTLSGGTGPYNWSVLSGSFPPGLTLSSSGIITGTPTSVDTFNFVVGVTDNSPTQQSASKPLAITINPVLTITPMALPLGVVGVFYSKSLEATGPSPVTWSVISKILPPGLQLSSSGTIFGTPAVPGTYDFTIQASGGSPVQTTTRDFQIVINPALTITTAALPDATLSGAYSVTLVATGGLAPYVWTNLSQRLPPGLTLSPSGVLSGNPTSLGTFTFTLQVADSFSPTQFATRNFTLSVATPLTITTVTLPNGFQNFAYNQQLQAVGTSPFGWTVSDGTLPEGLTLTPGGLLQGIPTKVGTSTFTITVTDARATATSRTYTLAIDPPLSSFSVKGFPATLSARASQDIALSLASPTPSALAGQLVLTFTSKAENPSDDPMTQFSNGTRTVSFTIPANGTDAVFPSKTTLLIGTVTGTVRLAANITNGPPDLFAGSTEVVATAPQITNVTATRTSGGIEVQITGFSPARRVTNVEFNFEVKTGKKTANVVLSRNVEADFDAWFRNTASTVYGAQFSFVQSFAVSQGDAASIQAVTVRLTNAQGSTSSAKIPLQ